MKGEGSLPYLIPVQYHRMEYPAQIIPSISEAAGHFDIKSLRCHGNYSLHTEYSYGSRKFSSPAVQPYDRIKSAHSHGIPKLWYDREWSMEFAEFILDCTSFRKPPEIIEIHPPFSDYADLPTFLTYFRVFQKRISERYPETKIFIENRSGSVYREGKFILSTMEQLLELSDLIDKNHLTLRITLDIPQLFTAHGISPSRLKEMQNLFDEIKRIRHNIEGIHLWGKKENQNGRRIAHHGDLNNYFKGRNHFKEAFLQSMHQSFDDDLHRYFVPEVNSNSKDLQSIVGDLVESGFIFVH